MGAASTTPSPSIGAHNETIKTKGPVAVNTASTAPPQSIGAHNEAQSQSAPSPDILKSDDVEKKRPCCVCKETRAARDLCFAEKDGFEECYKEIQLHKECMAKEGFKI